MRNETLILSSIVKNEDYMREVIPHLKPEFFSDRNERFLFKEMQTFVSKYNTTPPIEALRLRVSNNDTLTDDDAQELQQIIKGIEDTDLSNKSTEWAVDETEKFCKDKALYNAIMESIDIIEGNSKTKSKNDLPEILADALKVSFDTQIGHDYIEDMESRFDFYHASEERLPFSLNWFNKITKGGLPRKTLNIVLAGTNVGKTLIMCSLAADYLLAGKNVLYVTAEMAEERIAERIDANVLNVDLDDIEKLDKEQFKSRFANRVQSKTNGKLIIKEYPTSAAHAGHLRHLLKELKTKKNFVPDVMFIDYLGIMASSRMKLGGSINTNSYIKAIAEELRGLAKEFNLPIVTGAQTNRTGFKSTEIDLDDTAESFGLPQTADWMIGVVETEELAALGLFKVIQLKNRYRDKNKNKRFVIGVDKAKQRIYDPDDSAQSALASDGTVQSDQQPEDDTPVFDRGSFGERSGKKLTGGGFNFN